MRYEDENQKAAAGIEIAIGAALCLAIISVNLVTWQPLILLQKIEILESSVLVGDGLSRVAFHRSIPQLIYDTPHFIYNRLTVKQAEEKKEEDVYYELRGRIHRK